MNNQDILVSISVLVYNHALYLRKCLDSLVNQETDFNFEIIVHDDASTDGSADIIREYQEKYPNLIKPILQKENQHSKGVCISRQLIFPRAKGKYIAFCEGDDYWCDIHKLQKQVFIMEKTYGISVCVHKVEKINYDGTKLNAFIEPKSFTPGIIRGPEFIRSYFTGEDSYPFQTSSYFIRKEILLMDYPFRNKFCVGDIPMLLMSALNGDIYYMEDTMSCYRINVPGSYNDRLKNKDYSIRIIKSYIDAYQEFNADTNNKYKDFLHHNLVYFKAQYYYATHQKDKEQKKLFKKELSYKEHLIAKYKHSTFGNFLRNLKHKALRKK